MVRPDQICQIILVPGGPFSNPNQIFRDSTYPMGYSYVLVDHLNGIILRTRSTIPLSLVTSHHLINYKADLENLIFSNASHSFLIGEGTLITYDFKGIENDFADRFILNKLSIEDDLKVDHSEGKLCNIIKRLQLNIPQVS